MTETDKKRKLSQSVSLIETHLSPGFFLSAIAAPESWCLLVEATEQLRQDGKWTREGLNSSRRRERVHLLPSLRFSLDQTPRGSVQEV